MGYIYLLIFIWFAYWAVNITFAKVNNNIRLARIKANNPAQINHYAWAFYYLVAVSPIYFMFKDWFLVGSILLLKASVFPVAYNLAAGNPPFYLSKTTTSLFDRAMVYIGLTTTEIVNMLALLASVILLVISFFQSH